MQVRTNKTAEEGFTVVRKVVRKVIRYDFWWHCTVNTLVSCLIRRRFATFPVLFASNAGVGNEVVMGAQNAQRRVGESR
jgi:hypothetical protein